MRTARVEAENCISCGLCISICPEAFRFDSTGKSECFNPAGATEDEIQRAIDGCPIQCIHWMKI